MTNSETTVEINLRSEAVPGDGGVTTDVTEDSNKIVGLTIGGDFQLQDLVTETDLLEERNRLGGTTGRVSSAEPVDKKDTFREIVEIVSYVGVPNTWKETALLKRKPPRAVMPLEFVRQTQLNVQTQKSYFMGTDALDSGSSILLLSWSTYEILGKPGIVQTYTKRVLTANNSAVKIIGRVTLLVQLQPRLPEVEQEFVITAEEGIECLLGIDFLKTNNCVLNLHEEKLYSNHFKISIPLTTEKTQGVRAFAIAGQNTYIQSKNESLMKIRLADENGEEFPGVEGLVEAIEDFELKNGLLLAACMISMEDGWILIKVLNLTDAPVTVYKSTKVGTYFENKQNLVVNGFFTTQNKPKTLETFQMGKHANLEGSKLNDQQKESTGIVNETSTSLFTKLKWLRILWQN